jgi:hypothetical protein
MPLVYDTSLEKSKSKIHKWGRERKFSGEERSIETEGKIGLKST